MLLGLLSYCLVATGLDLVLCVDLPLYNPQLLAAEVSFASAIPLHASTARQGLMLLSVHSSATLCAYTICLLCDQWACSGVVLLLKRCMLHGSAHA